MIRFLIADDHSIVRFGLKTMLEATFSNCEVDEARNGEEVMDQIRKNDYHVLLLDLVMPNTDPSLLLHFIKNSYGQTKVLVISMNEEELYGMWTIQLGAQGYLKKDAPKEELETAVKTILSGKRYISNELTNILIQSSLEGKSINPFDQLTPRELQVALLMLQDLSPTKISETLQVQYGTINTLKHRVFSKLNISSRKELVTLASTYAITAK